MNLQTLADLYRHMEWADAAVWQATLDCPAAWADEKFREYLHHLHIVQWAFLRTWRGEPFDDAFPQFDEAEALLDWARPRYAEAQAHLAALTDTELSQPLPVAWAQMVEQTLGRPPATTTLGDTVLQVALHSLYHRGQINARLRAAGGQPPLVDYIVWVWFDRPAANWPAAEA